MLKRPETIVCGDIGLVLLSGLGSRRTHPVGAEGATMARRAPFPLSSIPAYIDQSMKLIVCMPHCASTSILQMSIASHSFPFLFLVMISNRKDKLFTSTFPHHGFWLMLFAHSNAAGICS